MLTPLINQEDVINKSILLTALLLTVTGAALADGSYDQGAGGYDINAIKQREEAELAKQLDAEKAEQAKQLKAKKAEQDRQKKARDERLKAEKIAYEAKKAAHREQLRKDAPAYLKTINNNSLCIEYGVAVRGESVEQSVDPNLDFKESPAMVVAEAKRRNIGFNNLMVKNKQVQIGMTICEMYASLGTPEHQNRTVNSHGVLIQHVYHDRLYVYTDNGVVTSWQD